MITCVLPIHCDISQCLNSCSNYLVPTVVIVLFSTIITWSDCYCRSLFINRRIWYRIFSKQDLNLYLTLYNTLQCIASENKDKSPLLLLEYWIMFRTDSPTKLTFSNNKWGTKNLVLFLLKIENPVSFPW